jgi:hypothetical protein
MRYGGHTKRGSDTKHGSGFFDFKKHGPFPTPAMQGVANGQQRQLVWA